MRISDWSSDVCSSDLILAAVYRADAAARFHPQHHLCELDGHANRSSMRSSQAGIQERNSRRFRSEEHTSELQSLMRISYAVFCLKKKKKQTHTRKQPQNISRHLHNNTNNKTHT